jgi:hypothetical protein
VTYAGIDYSTRAVDIVLLEEDSDRAKWHRFELDFLPGTDAFDRARLVATVMPRGVFWDEVVAVGIEDPRGYNAGALYRVQGAVLACLPAGLLVQPWVPSAWRRAVGLPGNASKEAVAMHAWRRVCAAYGGIRNVGTGTQDACDAYCIALATRSVVARENEAA